MHVLSQEGTSSNLNFPKDHVVSLFSATTNPHTTRKAFILTHGTCKTKKARNLQHVQDQQFKTF